MRLRPPTDVELQQFVASYGLPVRLTVNDNCVLTLGWIDDEDLDDPMTAIRHLLMNALDALDGVGDDG